MNQIKTKKEETLTPLPKFVKAIKTKRIAKSGLILECIDEMRQEIEKFAKELGFDLVGFTPAKISVKYADAFTKWLEKGKEADMEYMKKKEARQNLRSILPDAKTVIVLGVNYYREQKPLKSGHGRIARYAYGRDYHKTIGKKLKKLENYIREVHKGKTKAYVDTGPLLEKALAEQAGIGRIGKNSCLITKDFGSWTFLSEIITDLDISNKSEKQEIFNMCGNCKLCMEACPTGAIEEPGVINCNRCISYLTIENKEGIPSKFVSAISKAKTLYGCDICQEVCPHNKARQRVSNQPDFQKPIAGDSINLEKVKSIKTDEQFLKIFAGSPLMRAKRKGLQRNAETIAPNKKTKSKP